MSQKKINWTSQQSRAISEHERSVFVSASAGTGKTAVLSGSCVDVVTNASVCPDIWSILVLTFTDMAAEQMRSRIAQQLNLAIEAIKDAGQRQHLRRQLILIGAADISTIHSFCKRLITEHFYELGLDPSFRVLDADEAKLLKAEVLDKTIDFVWGRPNLADALSQLLTRRDLRSIEGFPSVIIEISDFLDSVISRDDWLGRARKLADAADPFAADVALAQKKLVEEKLEKALARIEFALKIYQSKNPAGQWAEKCRNTYIKPLQQLLDWLKDGRWEMAASALAAYQRPTVYKPKDAPEIADSIKELLDDAIGNVTHLKNLAVLNPEYLDKFSGAVGMQTMVLVELVKCFDNFYARAKKTINCLDFADLEHYTLRLLTTEQSTGEKIEPSRTALKLREKYKYIFVDEYQDINSVQQAILDMLSRPDNVFAVGDPKQSIYQWRGANPDIFVENLNRSSTNPDAGLGLRVDLNVNFRSARPILDFVNLVFGRIMTASFANIDYDQSAHLQPASQSNDVVETSPAVELHILDKPQKNIERDDTSEEVNCENEPAQTFSSRQLQAALIARRIKQMVGVDTNKARLHIFDRKLNAERPVEYRDIVILMRSLAGRNDFLEALRLSGIPVSCEATAGYFKATEITDMLSLLKVLDNPRRDIELAAVLRSPFFNLTDTQLVKIRLQGKKDVHKTDFYDCVIAFRKSDEVQLADKLAGVLATLDDWRAVARRGRLAELIWHIYRRTGCLSFVCALPDGHARRANLLKLHDRAIQFESFAGGSGVPSLTRFIDFIEKLLASGQDWAPAEPESAAGNAVRVLSVHKCKGLEFPVVFVADLDSSFNKKADRKDCLLDEQLTLGLQLIDPESNSRLDSLAWQVIDERKRRKTLAEEMRILYVAMTRAMDRLILVGCKDKNLCQRIITTASFVDDREKAVPRVILDSCSSHLDWVLSALSRQPLIHRAFETDVQIPPVNDDLFSIKLHDQPELEKLSILIQSSKRGKIISHKSPIINPQNLAGLKDSLNWQYPFGDAPQLPAKRSVTQLTHRNDEFTKLDWSLSLNRKPKIILETEQVDGRSIGSAAHLVLSQLDLTMPITTEAITHLINKLVADGAIPHTIAPLVNAEAIMKFFETDLGRAVLDKNNRVFREWPFTFAIPSSQWTESATRKTSDKQRATSDDSIIVQGIIDLLIETHKGLIVIDFKTDDVSAEGLTRRVELYRAQLDLYAQAAQAILRQKVLSKWLYFLKPGCKVEI
ncbi:MAG: helicase-exonuclease AddAB subunit AddA [Sedimentisphaerales bacterium]|nr:helicase-exonuclease AddAB subunit AddA [Sedimentisphaerales bacterium]